MSQPDLQYAAERTLSMLRESQTRQLLMLELLHRQRETSDPEEIMRAAAEAVGRYLQVDRAGFFEVRDDSLEFSGGWTAGRLSRRSGPFAAVGVGTGYLAAVRAGRTMRISDARADPLTADSVFPEIGTISVIGVPIIRNGLWHAGFYVNHSEVRLWTDDEIALARDVGQQTWDTVERARAEADLRQQWHTFDTALSNTPDFAYVLDLNGRFTYANRALLSLWEKTLEEVVGKNFSDLGYPQELAGRLQCQVRHVIDTRAPVRGERQVARPTGETGYYEYIFVPVFGPDGQVEAVTGASRDVTERKQAAEQIEDDRRRWRELLLQAPAAVAILRGPEHRFEWVNAAYLRLVERSAEALIGKTVGELFPEASGLGFIDLLDRVYKTGEPFNGHERLVRLHRGDGVWQDIYVNSVYLATRNVNAEIDGVFLHASDVTEMVLARRRIEERERQFRTLAETIPHLAWMANETGYIVWFNRRWYDYTGRQPEQMEGWGWQAVLASDVVPKFLERWRESITTGEPFEMIHPLKSAQGTYRSFLTRVEPVRDHQGRAVRWFGTATDITEQQRIEDELRRVNRELEEFAYVASHDMQEPLRIVNIYTQLILKQLQGKDDKLSDYAGFVQEGANSMEALIHDLLAFSRVVHEEQQPTSTADLSASFAEALSVLKSRIEETGAVITVESLPQVRGDTSQMAHVFQNLLSNALKYRKREVRPEIRVQAERTNDGWKISVRDNGIGFEPRYAGRIFGLFKRLHNGEYPGTGLGLAICQRIVERYGGRIWAEGTPGEGATFFFSMPGAEGA